MRLHEEFREPKVDITSQGSTGSVISQTPVDNVNNLANNNPSPITQTPRISRRSLVNNTGSQSSTQFSKNKNNIRKPVSIYDPVSQNRNLNRYIQCVQEESLLTSKTKTLFRDNITKEQREAIKTLIDKIDKKHIIITKADKGSGLVAIDYDMYIQKGTKYIEEEAKAYEKVNDSTKVIINKLIKNRNIVVQQLKNSKVIEIETATYCTKQLEEKITGLKFYYKIHKDTNIQTMPLRPLQSCINAPTHHLSQVLTDILQPYLRSTFIPTYLQDSNQLLYKLERLNNPSSEDTLITSDVAALYPSIPYEEGMLAITDFLGQNSEFSEEQISNIVKALELVITQNYVVWNNNIYKQTSGVAMGTPVAVAYANIFMH